MTLEQIDAYYQAHIAPFVPPNTPDPDAIAAQIYTITGSAVTGGVVADFNRAVRGLDVRDNITYLSMLIRAYNDLVETDAQNVPSNAATRLERLEAMGLASNPDASGNYAHSEGINTTASGDYSHAEGNGTQATEGNSHAEGNGTQANASCAHAEGYLTEANGSYSHAEGHLTTAGAWASHAEGYGTNATKNFSHAEGQATTASGVAAHAEGEGCIAGGRGSHAEGLGTYAERDYQHVIGKYNASDSDAAFIVGNGSSDNNRSNAATIKRDGDARFAGNVYSDGNKLATESYVGSSISNLASKSYVDGKTGNATKNEKGVVQIGNGIDVSDGVISLNGFEYSAHGGPGDTSMLLLRATWLAGISAAFYDLYKIHLENGSERRVPVADQEYAQKLYITGSDNKLYGGVLKCDDNGKPVFEYDEVS